jgi:hypothetical protein
MLFNPATARATAWAFKTLEDGRKVRYFKSTGEVWTPEDMQHGQTYRILQGRPWCPAA